MSDVLKRTSRPLCLQQPASPPGSHDARCTCAGVVPAPFILLAGHYRPVSGSILLAFADLHDTACQESYHIQYALLHRQALSACHRQGSVSGGAQLRALTLFTYLDVHIAACQDAVHMCAARQKGVTLLRFSRPGRGRTTSSEHACTARLRSAGEGEDSVRSAAQPTASMLRRRRQCLGARRPSMMQPLTLRLSRLGMRSSALSRPVPKHTCSIARTAAAV